MKTIDRIANRIYRVLFRRYPGLRSRSVQTALAHLSDAAHPTEEKYYTAKIARTLAVLGAGSLLVVFVHVSDMKDAQLGPRAALTRAAYGKGSTTERLNASTEEGETLGAYEIDLAARQYTEEEARALFEEASTMLPGRILGENPSLDQVSKPLVLPSSMEGYPFKISYATSHYARLKTDGVPQTADLPAEGETVTLTATYTCASGTFEQPIRVRVVPQEKSMEARVREEMEGAIRKVQEETLHEEIMPLPEIFHGKKIVWSRERSRAAPVLFLLVLVAAGCLYFAKDKELQKKMKQREESLKNAYPQFVSRLTLYLSAGMTVRGVFLKAADDYAKKRKEGTKKDALSEEIRRASAHLSNGVSETVVYERFAARCGLTEYTRLCSLLAQNLKKGSAHLLLLLRQEAQMSVREQMDRARVLGEQAGSRLMIPMMLMLMVVMVLVMVPAYLSF